MQFKVNKVICKVNVTTLFDCRVGQKSSLQIKGTLNEWNTHHESIGFSLDAIYG